MISSKLLSRFSLFAGVAPIALEELATICEVVMLEKDQWLFCEGDPADALYLIITGRVSLNFTLGTKQTDYTTLSTRQEGDLLGWSAIVEPHSYKFGALATASTQLVRFDGKRLLGFMKENSDCGYPVMQAVTAVAAQRLMNFHAKLESLEVRQHLLFGDGH